MNTPEDNVEFFGGGRRREEDEQDSSSITPTKILPKPVKEKNSPLEPKRMGTGQRQISDPIGEHRAATMSGSFGKPTASRAYAGLGQKTNEEHSPMSVKEAKDFVASQYVTRGDLANIVRSMIYSFIMQIPAETGSVSPEVLEMIDGSLQWGPAGGGAMPFSGFAWVGNKPMITVNLADAGATNFLSIRLDGSGYDWVGSMPTSQPADAVVFDLSQTAGNIHIPGSIAPGG